MTATIANQGLNDMSNFDIELVVDGQSIETLNIPQTIPPFGDADFQFTVPQDFSAIGDYNVRVIVSQVDDGYGNNDTLDMILSKVHSLDGEISVGDLDVICNDVVEVEAVIENHGETTITEVAIEVIVNGAVVDIINATVDVPFQEQDLVTFTINSNLQLNNNDISLNLLSINNQGDGDLTNNSISTNTSLVSNYDIITLVINPDNYPNETSWELFDAGTNQLVTSGSLPNGNQYVEDICVDYASCFTLYMYDSYGDGICCGYGIGDFMVLNSSDQTIVYNNGDFGSEAIEAFCPDGTGCDITADVNITHSSAPNANDGVITINTSAGVSPFQYSIDGGVTFSATNSFSGLMPGVYVVIVEGATGLCSFEETVTVEACELIAVDITSTNASSVVSTDGMIEITPMSGIGPYQFSIDGGQNFYSSNVFANLPVGPYNVVVQDASGICAYEEVVPITVDGLGIDNEFVANGINLYPNPTKNDFTIEVESVSALTESIQIVVYDKLGRIIETGSISIGGNGKVQISLNEYVTGTYFVKCFSNSLEKHFKVVKL